MYTSPLLPVPAPQKFEIELDTQTLTVPDLSKPVWHGSYFAGKLSVYLAEVTGEVIPDSVTYVSTYAEHGGPEFLFYTFYEQNIPVEEIVTHLQRVVFNQYQSTLEETDGCGVSIIQGNNTKH